MEDDERCYFSGSIKKKPFAHFRRRLELKKKRPIGRGAVVNF
jgi:hypothetical protein